MIKLFRNNSYKKLDNQALLSAVEADDKEAFSEIYERYWQKAFSLAFRKLQSKEAAEEIVQDLFMSLWIRRHTAKINNLEYYLFSSLKYTIIDYIEAQMVRKKYKEYYEAFASIELCETEDKIIYDDLCENLQQMIEKFPEKTKEVFHLSRFQHFSIVEIAAKLNLSEKAVEYHLTRSLKILRGELKDLIILCISLLFLS